MVLKEYLNCGNNMYMAINFNDNNERGKGWSFEAFQVLCVISPYERILSKEFRHHLFPRNDV